MNCLNCGGTLSLVEGKDHLICGSCRSLRFPEPNDDGVRVLGEWAAQRCPICRTPLAHAAHSGTRLMYCESCRGMLLGMEEFVALVEKLRGRKSRALPPRPVQAADLERRANCPECGVRMHTHIYGGPGNIVIDNCPVCRLNWLDHEELVRITSAEDPEWSAQAWSWR